jgi:site-specific DNA recombinase
MALRRENLAGSHQLNHPDFPLRRFVSCRRCGTPLTGSAPRGRSRSYPYYHCRKCKGVSIRREALESQFLALLDGLRPRAEFIRLFRAIVLDAWKERRAGAGRLRIELEDRIRGLRERETRLEDAYLFEKLIDVTTYERQRDRIRQDIAVSELELEDAKLDEIDVEGLLGFAEHVLGNAATLWLEADVDQKQRIQRALFPKGLEFEDGRIGTAVTCLAFSEFRTSENSESGLASPTGFEPVFWP